MIMVTEAERDMTANNIGDIWAKGGHVASRLFDKGVRLCTLANDTRFPALKAAGEIPAARG
jgi:hypothetical protein